MPCRPQGTCSQGTCAPAQGPVYSADHLMLTVIGHLLPSVLHGRAACVLPVVFSKVQSTLLLQVTSYAIESAQQRGRLFCASGDEVYEGQVVGIHQRAGDLRVNVCKRKAANNIRRWAVRCCVSLAEGMFTQGLGEEPCMSPLRRRRAATTACR